MTKLQRVGVAAMAAAVCLCAAPAEAVEVELKNDGFADNGQAICQQGFAVGDQAGVTFTHDEAFQLLRMQFLFCGATTTETVTIRIYREQGGAVPGEAIYEGDYQIEGSSDALSEINLAGENLQFNAGDSFRFALVHQHMGAPGIGNDSDGDITPGVNWIFDTASGANGAWAESSSFGVTGDWVVRAYIDVDDGGTGPGGGGPGSGGSMMGAGGSGGEGGAGSEDGGGDDEESCSCDIVGAPSSGNTAWLAIMGLGLLARRRRHAE